MFTASDIATAICHSCDKNEKLILQALLLVKNDLSPAKVAEDFSVHCSTVHCWMKRAEEEGLSSLKCKPGRGVKSYLTAEQLSELRKALSKPISIDDGFSRGWKTGDTQNWVTDVQDMDEPYG
ncbi:hypothetical protein MSBRW_1953 [Methanosarcina barkeri str. Wiesmoor]|uniref:Transposase n=2 Tax=Methanosarcina barkeri TaxID=2208 RepID=A0A0E3LLG0_METBA|nr:hypothetical protein MSBRW_1953 [Methanosarcina barkeri str. Wiesmoor]